ncbi:MAG: ribosome maturation factor RimP [Myxococcales bacterium FL481]|nr:MAG: ribosome maturation factor RimP [Myxococcales bacterium FL481]
MPRENPCGKGPCTYRPSRTRRHNTSAFFFFVTAISQPASASSERVLATDPVAAVLESLLASLGYELVANEWIGTGGRRRVLRVYVDRPGGISLDDCARLSHAIGNTLDAAEAETTACASLLKAPYVLEVSSPGLDRPLVKRSHFARFVGHRIKVQLLNALDVTSNQRTFHGVIRAVRPDPQVPEDERDGVVDLEPLEGGAVTSLRITNIRRANLVYEG